MLFTKLLLCLSCTTSWAFFVQHAHRDVGSRALPTSSLRALGVATSADSNIGDKPSIAIVGSGAVGSYYGSRLWETGLYDVKFYMRGGHYETSVEEGLTVTSVDGDIFIPPESLQAYNETSKIGPVDWVIVSLKSTALDAIPALVAPLLDPSRTRVLVIMNGLIEEDLIRQLKSQVGEEQDVGGDSILHCCAALYGGMALVCCNRLGPGRVNHSYAGLLSGGVAACNPSTTTGQENKDAFNQLWEPTKITTKYEPCLLAGRWRKNVWNLPFNGVSVAMGGITVDKIVLDPGLRQLADMVMDETIATANADLAKNGFDESFYLSDQDKRQMFDLSDNMGPYRTSTMIDLVDRNPMEVEFLFRKPVERAIRLGVPVPHLQTLVLQIEAFQRFHNLF